MPEHMHNEITFRRVYQDYLTSGLSVPEYCSQKKIQPYTFYYWQSKLRKQASPTQGFVPIAFEPAPSLSQDQAHGAHLPISPLRQGLPPSSTPLSVEITYPEGVCVKINGHLPLEQLQVLLNSIRR